MTETTLTKRLIADGLRPARKALTDAQALAERCEFAATASGIAPAERKRILLEAAAFIRASNGLPAKSEKAA